MSVPDWLRVDDSDIVEMGDIVDLVPNASQLSYDVGTGGKPLARTPVPGTCPPVAEQKLLSWSIAFVHLGACRYSTRICLLADKVNAVPTSLQMPVGMLSWRKHEWGLAAMAIEIAGFAQALSAVSGLSVCRCCRA